MELFNISFSLLDYILLSFVFAITSAITEYDKKLTLAYWNGQKYKWELLPKWVGRIIWLHWALCLLLLAINWKYALVVFIIKYLFSITHILEHTGNLIVSLFRKKQKPPFNLNLKENNLNLN